MSYCCYYITNGIEYRNSTVQDGASARFVPDGTNEEGFLFAAGGKRKFELTCHVAGPLAAPHDSKHTFHPRWSLWVRGFCRRQRVARKSI
eukprot:470896-Rhodomonas_salina.6